MGKHLNRFVILWCSVTYLTEKRPGHRIGHLAIGFFCNSLTAKNAKAAQNH